MYQPSTLRECDLSKWFYVPTEPKPARITQTPQFDILISLLCCCITLSFQISTFVHCGNHGTAAVPRQVLPSVTPTDRASACVGVYAIIPVFLRRLSKHTHIGCFNKRCNCRGRTIFNRTTSELRSNLQPRDTLNSATTAAVQRSSTAAPVAQQQWCNNTRASRSGLCGSHGAFVFVHVQCSPGEDANL